MLLCAEAYNTACFKEYFSGLLQADLLVPNPHKIILLQYIRIVSVIFAVIFGGGLLILVWVFFCFGFFLSNQ